MKYVTVNVLNLYRGMLVDFCAQIQLQPHK